MRTETRRTEQAPVEVLPVRPDAFSSVMGDRRGAGQRAEVARLIRLTFRTACYLPADEFDWLAALAREAGMSLTAIDRGFSDLFEEELVFAARLVEGDGDAARLICEGWSR